VALELQVLGRVEQIFGDLQELDAGPTSQTEAAAQELQNEAKAVTERWRAIGPEVASLNSALEAARMEKIKINGEP
jgi:hypothetical protein